MKKMCLFSLIFISVFLLTSCSFTTSQIKKTDVEKTEEKEKTEVKDPTVKPTEPVETEKPTETVEIPEKTEPVPTVKPTEPAVTPNPTEPIEPTKPVDPVEPQPDGKDYYDEENTAHLYDELFDINNKVVVKVNISNSEISKIESDYQSYGSECNIYRIADSVEITITNSDGDVIANSVLEEVGIRMKGNTTRHSFYENGITSLIHFKIDFQETFDDDFLYSYNEIKEWSNDLDRENRKNRTFFGLRGLELKYNAEGDLTYTRDIYASKVYREHGIYAQSTTLGILDFNIGNSSSKSGTLGVYKIYEPVDRVFVKRYFPQDNNDGDLYKASWGRAKGMPSLNSSSSSCYGVDNSEPGEQKSISYDLKTNKKKSTHASISSLLKWINGSSSNLNSTLNNYIDEEYYVTWLAIMYITGDWDNFMYDSNNYFMYFDETGICYFIPYDMDRTFGLQAKLHNMADRKPLDTWNLQGDGNRSKLLKKTIDVSNSHLRNKYLAKIKELSVDILDANEFKEYYNIIYSNYKNDIVPTMKTLVYDNSNKTENPFYHLIIGNGEYIKYNDSTDKNNAIESYFNKKQTVINANC